MKKHHPNRIWLRTYQVDGYHLHFKVTDCEQGQEPEEATITHLIYNRRSGGWSGYLQRNEERFILTSQQAEFLFIGFFAFRS